MTKFKEQNEKLDRWKHQEEPSLILAEAGIGRLKMVHRSCLISWHCAPLYALPSQDMRKTSLLLPRDEVFLCKVMTLADPQGFYVE